MDQGDIVTTIVPTEEHEGDLKILGKLTQPWPPYPETARAKRRRGQLYLSIVVNPDGSVSEVQITKPLDELLDKSAVETVRTWRFKVHQILCYVEFPHPMLGPWVILTRSA